MESSLYQQIILDHHKHPRCYGSKEHPDAYSEELNQLCGDKICVYVNRDNEGALDISFEASACSIVRASASIMASMLNNHTLQDALQIKELFEKFLINPTIDTNNLGDLVVFEGVRQYPTRKKCALLPWKALEKSLVSLSNENNGEIEMTANQ